MGYLISIIGLLVVFGLALLVCKNKKEIKYKNIVIMVIIQIILASLLLNTTFGYVLIKGITNVIDHLLSYANTGITFVFGLAFLVSKNKKEIKYKNIVIMLIVQLILAAVLLNTTFGYVLITGITNVFDHILAYANTGISFVFLWFSE